MEFTKQGSGNYRKIISRSHTLTDIHTPSRWKSKLRDDQITRSQVKQAKINLHTIYLGSDTADILTRLKLGKTLFGTQLEKCGILDNPYCATCLRELNEEYPENIAHATYDCGSVKAVINSVLDAFFPNCNEIFYNRDILLAIIEDKHHYYTGKIGQCLASLVWDFFLKYVMTCRSNNRTPVPEICLHEIKSQINRILKILPRSEVTNFIHTSPSLSQMFTL